MPPKRKDDESNRSNATTRASRRTRSQVAPDWTLRESLSLVNEILAVEGDCQNAVAPYQKWKIISNTCAGLEVHRSLDQCRRKWEALQVDYHKILRWEEGCGADSYWGLGTEYRKDMGLPEEFDRELFEAVQLALVARAERASFDTDAELEDKDDDDADVDLLDDIPQPVFKKQSHQLTPQKRHTEAKKEKKHMNEKEAGSEGPIFTQLREKAEMIQAILEGKLADNNDYKLSDLKKDGASRRKLARRQGDKLIDCFKDIAHTLDQLCNVTHSQ